MSLTNKRVLQGRIFGACKALGLDKDTRHDLQMRVTGKSSTTKMTAADMQMVVDELNAQGAQAAKRKKYPEAERPDQKFVIVLWRLLAEAGVVDRQRAALRKFISSQNFQAKYGDAETDPNMLSAERCYDVIEALKAVARRHNVKVDRR